MSTWRDKAEARFKSSLAPGERETRRGEGLVGLKEAFFVLTNKRVFIFWPGTTKWSEPNTRDIDLKHIVSAYCEPNLWPKGPNLVIESRTGTFSVALTKTARKESELWPKWILEAQDALHSQPQTSGPPPGAAERIRRRWNLLNDLRPLGEKSQLGKPYGTDDHLRVALRYVSADLNGIDEVRESAGTFAISLKMGIQRQAFDLYDMISIMGADERQQGVDALTAAETAQVYECGRAAHKFLRDFEDGPTWKLFQQRDDFARDVLVWLIVVIHRLGSAGLGPVFPEEPPL